MLQVRSVATTALAVALFLQPRVVRAEEMLTLAKAIELVEQRAPEIAEARARTSSLSAQSAAARAAYLPTLGLTQSGSGTAARDVQPVSRDEIVRSVTYTGAATTTGSVRWTLFDFGRTSSAVDSGDAAVRAAAASADEAVAQARGEGALSYLTAFHREELRHVAEATVAQRERLLSLARTLVKAGLQPPLEELRANARLMAARRDLASAEGSALDARILLAALVGLPSSLHLAEPRLPVIEVDLERATRASEAARDTVRAAQESLASARSAVFAASARRRPSLSLNLDGVYRLAENDVIRLRGSTLSAVGAVVVSIPIFDPSITPGVNGASADVAAAEARLALTLREAHTEAGRAAAAVQTSTVGVEHARKAREAASSVFLIVHARYAQGLASPLELIDAEASDAEARSTLVVAELTRALALVRLLVATGRTAALKEGGST